MRFSFISLGLLLGQAQASSIATTFSGFDTKEITLEGAITELRDAIHDQGSESSQRLLAEHRDVQDEFVATHNNDMASIQDTLLHVTAALQQQDDEEAVTLNIKSAIDKLHSIMDADRGVDRRRRQLVSPDNAIIGETTSSTFMESVNGIRGAVSEDSKKTARSHIEIVKKAFKTAVAKLHYTLQDEENSRYLSQRIVQISEGEAEQVNDAVAEATHALETILDGLSGLMSGENGENRETTKAVLDVMATLLALPVKFLTESVAFAIDYTSHQLTCLKSEESTARMQMILFVDYLMRMHFDVETFRLRDGFPSN